MNTKHYENRIIAFVDILGFGAWVESSSNDESKVSLISSALDAANPEAVQDRLYTEVNWHKIPQAEAASARDALMTLNRAMSQQHEVRISYFSDSLVLSAAANNLIASQLVIDIVGRLQITFWRDHGLLLRGGLHVGQLYHVQGGQIFGPAMNCAYHHESKVAVFPRVVITDACWKHFQVQDTFGVLAPFFRQEEDLSRGMSLAECYLQMLGHSSLFFGDSEGEKSLRENLQEAPAALRNIRDSISESRIVAKYDWLIPRVEEIASRYPIR